MLCKNFGLDRLGRLVFYDYDENQTMTEMNFRVIPEPPNAEAEMASEPWYPVAANDVFPEEFDWFLLGDPLLFDAFEKYKYLLLTDICGLNCLPRSLQEYLASNIKSTN